MHLVSAEDIGFPSELLPGEVADPSVAKLLAERHLNEWEKDPDMAVDTRACVPVLKQPGGYRLWCTLGVKTSTLETAYLRAPQGRPRGSQGEWIRLDVGAARRYVLLADDFAEVQAPKPFTRAELRAVADREKKRERIIEAMAK